jgi:rRNA maturation endonuclease Nob1
VVQFFAKTIMQAGRSFNSSEYRYGFGGQEKDDEIAGEGNSYTAEFWQYSPMLARRWNIDPVSVPWESPYAVFRNNPIVLNDQNGDCPDCSNKKAEDTYWKVRGDQGADFELSDDDQSLMDDFGLTTDLQVKQFRQTHSEQKYLEKYGGVEGGGNYGDVFKDIMSGSGDLSPEDIGVLQDLRSETVSQVKAQYLAGIYSIDNVSTIVGMGLMGLSSSTQHKAFQYFARAVGSRSSAAVWGSMSNMGPNLVNTQIPKYFTFATRGGKVFVSPNATKHLGEVVLKGGNATANAGLKSQIMLSSMKGAVDKVMAQGIQYGKMYNVGGWELKFAAPRAAGELPAVIHALPKF